MPSLYALKPRFQGLLRPLVQTLARAGVTANQITILACLLSAALGLALASAVADPVRYANSYRLFLLLPPFLLLRMALNAIDGMLAREHRQQSTLGVYLNELTDVFSDALLYLPFAYIPGVEPLWIAVLIALGIIAEMTGTVAVMAGAQRRFDGPMGKSDRAFWFGALALWIGLRGENVSAWLLFLFPKAMALLLGATVVNRVRQGLAQAAPPRSAPSKPPTA